MLPDWTNNIDQSWTLFLDRDGVINVNQINDYVTHWEKFVFLDDVLAAIPLLNRHFARTIIITNQQGVAKELMSAADLLDIHQKMMNTITHHGGRIDAIYAATEWATDPSNRRKPKPDMALEAQVAFPEIDFQKSIMVGDYLSDMEFGQKLGMKCVLIDPNRDLNPISTVTIADSLWEFANSL
ncbi:UNVERIFIED_CONTAM: hypothetical protein GTU68_021024 [Idotea baltica]|nr:hypothetical protein [Idotea baltica]